MAAIDAGQPNQRRATRVFRERATLNHLRDAEVLTRYRLSREGINWLADILKDDLGKATNRSNSIPVLTQVNIHLSSLYNGHIFP